MVARGVNGVLQFETRRPDSGGRVFAAEAASPLTISKGVWEALLLSQRGPGRKPGHSTIFLYFEEFEQLILLRYYG